MKTNKIQSHQWFTLIELLVVITIIGILATVWVANFSGALSWARDSTRISNIKVLQAALTQYYSDKWEYLNDTTLTVDTFKDKIKTYLGSSYPADSKSNQEACRKMDVTWVEAPADTDGWFKCGTYFWVGKSSTWMTNGWYKLGTTFEKESNVFWEKSQARLDGGAHPGLYEVHDWWIGATAKLTETTVVKVQ